MFEWQRCVHVAQSYGSVSEWVWMYGWGILMFLQARATRTLISLSLKSLADRVFFFITAAISPLHRKTVKYVTPLYTDKSFTGPTHLKGHSSLYVARCVKWPPCISFWLPEDPQSCPTFDFYFLFLLFLFYFQFQFLLLWMLQRSSVSSCEANKWWACSHGDLIHAASHYFLIHIFFSLGASHESVHSCISCEKGRVVSSANTEHVSWGTACDVSWVRCGRYLGQQRRVIEQQQQEELVLVQLLQWALFQQPGVMIRPQVVGRSTWFPVRRYIYHQLLSPRCQYQSINQSIH